MSQISNRPVDWETLVKENETACTGRHWPSLGDAQGGGGRGGDTFLKFRKRSGGVGQSCLAMRVGERVPGLLVAAWRRRSAPVGVPPAPEPGGAAGAGGDLFPLLAGRPGCHPSVLPGTLHRRDRPALGQAEGPSGPALQARPAQEIARRRNKMNQYKSIWTGRGIPSLHAQLTALAR